MEAGARFAENPFYVLGLPPACSRVDVERAGQRLLAMIELGLASAHTYATPVGERTRTADDVRRAMAELRDPDRRLAHEWWATLAPAPEEEPEAPPAGAALAPWCEALAALGWRRH